MFGLWNESVHWVSWLNCKLAKNVATHDPPIFILCYAIISLTRKSREVTRRLVKVLQDANGVLADGSKGNNHRFE